MKKENILGFDVCTVESKELLKNIFYDFDHNIQNFIVNINPEIIVQNYKNDEFKKMLNEQKYQIPDGIGVILASKIRKGKIKKRVTGIDFMDEICKESTSNSAKIFLYGGKPGVAEEAKKQLEKKYAKINIVGVCDGYITEEEAIKNINKVLPDILFVGLGSPKQEEFIIKNKSKLKSVKVFMPVGGSFDVISNNLKRAPKWMIKMNLEWLYRLIKQPSRIFRQVKLLKFIFLCMNK